MYIFQDILCIDGLVPDCSKSSALAMELLQSCTKPSVSSCVQYQYFIIVYASLRKNLDFIGFYLFIILVIYAYSMAGIKIHGHHDECHIKSWTIWPTFADEY